MHDYMKNGIEIIKQSKALSSKDEKVVIDLQDELDACNDKQQFFRTETEMLASVLSKFPSIPGKYWQCVREQTSMFRSMVSQTCEVYRLEGELDLLQLEFDELDNTPKSKAQKKVLTSQIKEKEIAIAGIKLHIHYRVVEIKHWEKLKKKFLNSEEFDSDYVEKHQKESYTQKWSREITLGKNEYNNKVNLLALED